MLYITACFWGGDGGESKFVCSDYRSVKPHRLHTTRLSPNSRGCTLLQRVYLFLPPKSFHIPDSVILCVCHGSWKKTDTTSPATDMSLTRAKHSEANADEMLLKTLDAQRDLQVSQRRTFSLALEHILVSAELDVLLPL